MGMILVTFFVMMLVIAGMAVGVIFKNKPLKGSCGGLNQIGLGGKCDICGSDTRCESTESGSQSTLNEVKRTQDASLAKNAMSKQDHA